VYDDQKSVEAARQIDLLCDEFERALVAGETPLIESYLPRVDSRYRVSLLAGLLGVEVDCRIARRELPTFEDYADRFPELSVEEMADARFPELAGEIRRLFKGHQAPVELSNQTPIASDAQSTSQNGGGTVSSPIRQGPPQIPGYRVGELLGHGGMGLVYRARQLTAHRDVALKVLLHGATATSDEIQRFCNEARAASRLDHPGIVAIYDVGPEGMLPYYSMALVEGPTLKHELEAGPFEPKRAARLLVDIAEAVQYGHDHGVIHRDLKPSNVLLSADGRVRIADFGLAKLLSDGSAAETLTGQVLGTPSYMAPEQARGIRGEVSSSVDIYALGALLYTLLTGRPPFLAANVAETLRQVCEDDPVPLRRRNRSIPEDLDTITIKCLEKSPGKRYTTAGAFAEDLRRYLKGVPILARPQRFHHRCWRWSVRNPMTAALIAGIVILSVGGLVELLLHDRSLKRLNSTITSQNAELRQTAGRLGEALRESKKIEAKATKSERHAQSLLHVAELQLAAKAWRNRDSREASLILSENAQRLATGEVPDFAWRYLHWQNSGQPADLADSEHGQLIDQDRQQLYHATLSRDLRWLATCGSCGWIRVYDAQNEYQFVKQIATDQVEVNSLAFNHNASLLASAGDDGRVCLWSWPAGELVRSVAVYPGEKVFGVAFVNDRTRFVTCGTTNQVILWEASTGMPLQKWVIDAKSGEAVAVRNRYKGRTEDVIAVTTKSSQIVDIRLDEGAVIEFLHRTPVPLGNTCTSIAFSANRQFQAAGFADGRLRVFDGFYSNNRQVVRPDGIDAVAVRWDGTIICTDRGGSITVDVPSAKEKTATVQRTWSGGAPQMPGLVIGPDAKHFVTAGSNGEVRRWPIDPPAQNNAFTVIPARDGRPSGHLSFVEDPLRVLRVGTYANHRALFLQPCSQNSELRRAEYHLEASCCDSRNGVIVVGTVEGSVLCLKSFEDPQPRVVPVTKSQFIDDVLLYRRGEHVLVRSMEHLFLLDLADGRTLAASNVDAITTAAPSPDGAWIAAGERNTNALLILDGTDLSVRRRCLAHTKPPFAADFSPDGRQVVSVGEDRMAIVWNAFTGERLRTLSGHRAAIRDVAHSSDGRVIATADDAGVVKLWSSDTGTEFYELTNEAGHDSRIAFSPDGSRLIVGQADGSLAVFEAPIIKSSE
jgi:serine/threonine protein kinase/WD40 repeat protein